MHEVHIIGPKGETIRVALHGYMIDPTVGLRVTGLKRHQAPNELNRLLADKGTVSNCLHHKTRRPMQRLVRVGAVELMQHSQVLAPKVTGNYVGIEPREGILRGPRRVWVVVGMVVGS